MCTASNLLQPCTLALLYALWSSFPYLCTLTNSFSHSCACSLCLFLSLMTHIFLLLLIVCFPSQIGLYHTLFLFHSRAFAALALALQLASLSRKVFVSCCCGPQEEISKSQPLLVVVNLHSYSSVFIVQ